MTNPSAVHERIANIEASLEAAPARPWPVYVIHQDDPPSYLMTDMVRSRWGDNSLNFESDKQLADFFSEAPGHLEFLISVIRKQRKALQEIAELTIDSVETSAGRHNFLDYQEVRSIIDGVLEES